MEEIIKELEQIGVELFNKYGADCYTTRCRLHDAREKLKALTIHNVVNREGTVKLKSVEEIKGQIEILNVLKRHFEGFNQSKQINTKQVEILEERIKTLEWVLI